MPTRYIAAPHRYLGGPIRLSPAYLPPLTRYIRLSPAGYDRHSINECECPMDIWPGRGQVWIDGRSTLISDRGASFPSRGYQGQMHECPQFLIFLTISLKFLWCISNRSQPLSEGRRRTLLPLPPFPIPMARVRLSCIISIGRSPRICAAVAGVTVTVVPARFP